MFPTVSATQIRIHSRTKQRERDRNAPDSINSEEEAATPATTAASENEEVEYIANCLDFVRKISRRARRRKKQPLWIDGDGTCAPMHVTAPDQRWRLSESSDENIDG